MGRLRMKVKECKYKETDKRLNQQFINNINDRTMTVGIVKD